MANTQAMCSNFKWEVMTGIHALGPGTGVPARVAATADVLKAALYLTTATINAGTAAYTAVGELAASGNYAAGGATVTTANAPSLDGTTGIFQPSASLVWAALTSSGAFDAVLIYNSSQSNKSISVHTFGSQSIVAGTFTLTMPAYAAATALIRIA